MRRAVARDALALPKDVALFWATQPAAGCAREPLTRPPREMPTFWNARVNARYNWAEYEERDAEAQTFWTANNARTQHEGTTSHHHPTHTPPVRLMDLRPLWMRPDAHVGSSTLHANGTFDAGHPPDCLHQCVPGPLSHLVPRVLMSMLAN